MGYSLAHVDEIEPGGPGGAVRFVRRELGVEAFGINWFELPPVDVVMSKTMRNRRTRSRRESMMSRIVLGPA